jgi:hypothetical protein
MEYTKGTWKLQWKARGNDIEAIIKPGENALVATTWFGEQYRIHEAESIANAHLIAAAPDMYEALKAVVEMLDPFKTEVQKALMLHEKVEILILKALTKAEGK